MIVNTISIKNNSDRAEVQIEGNIERIKEIKTKKGDPMAFVKLDDDFGSIQIVVFPKLYSEVRSDLQISNPIKVVGRLHIDDEDKTKEVLAEEIYVKPAG